MELLPALEKDVCGTCRVGTPEAEAGLLISRFGAPDVGAALAAGRRVILINGTKVRRT